MKNTRFITVMIFAAMLSLSGSSLASDYRADDLTYEEWLERYGGYLGGGGMVCKNGYLDYSLGGLGTVTKYIVSPVIAVIIATRTGCPVVGALAGGLLNYGATFATDELAWLCRCAPVMFDTERIYRDADGHPIMTETRTLKTQCCTVTPVHLMSTLLAKCMLPYPTIDMCIKDTEIGANRCFR